MTNNRIQTLQKAVARYEKTLGDFDAINEELRTLPPNQKLAEILAMNEQSMATTKRLLESTRERLEMERALGAWILAQRGEATSC